MGQSTVSMWKDSTPLLWVLARPPSGYDRHQIRFAASRQCGPPARSISTGGSPTAVPARWPVAAVAGKQITTIEGLAVGGKLTAVQQALGSITTCPQLRLFARAGMIMAGDGAAQAEAQAHRTAHIDAAITNICSLRAPISQIPRGDSTPRANA